MRIELLLVPDCPLAPAAREALAVGLDELGLDTVVHERVGDYPSPTVLVDGRDVMTGILGVAQTAACRLDVPTAAQITAAVQRAQAAVGQPSADTDEGVYPPQLAVGVTSTRLAQVSAPARRVHKAILTAFADTGHAPSRQALAETPMAEPDLDRLLAELHERDVIRLDDAGGVRAAYPFSGVPTAHTVAIDAGPTVSAMCAVDALGMADMLGRDITITSADPASGKAIGVRIEGGLARWEPDTAVVFVGSNTDDGDAGCCPPEGEHVVAAAAERCCGVMNFFAGHDTAAEWIAAHPQVSGVVLTQQQALRLGADIFGRLLHD